MSNTNAEEEFVLIWEAPSIKQPEFRLYYDDKGYVLTYTCDDLPGNYVVIDAQTFAECRPDVRVIDGRIVSSSTEAVISKLAPSITGINCESEDISIITTRKKNTQRWELHTKVLKT